MIKEEAIVESTSVFTKRFADDQVYCLEASDSGDLCAFYMKGHIDKQKFVGVLKDEGFVDEDEEFEDEDIVHTYGRLDEENMWRTRETPKEGYELVTIYDCY